MHDTATAEVEQIEVTQEDRDAVYDYLCSDARYLFTPVERLAFKSGKHDDNPLVQAFARHARAALAHLKAPQPYVKVEDE